MENLKKHIQSIVDIYKSGNLSEAEFQTKKLISEKPKVVFLYNLLGVIYSDQNKVKEAVKAYEKGISLDPNFGMIYSNLGLLFYKNKTDSGIKKAEELYKKAISLDKKNAEPHNNLGNLYDYTGKASEAINCYQEALKINPNFAYAHHNLGTTYVSMGKFHEAKRHFNESIRLDPNFIVTHRSLSRITKYTEDNEHFNKLKIIYKNLNSKETEKRIEIGFALGKAYDDIKNYDKSFEHYDEANTLHRKKINFSLKSEKESFEEIKKIYTKELFEKYTDSGLIEHSPIFILGMPRSSTTLVEQILSSHPKVFGADEVDIISSLKYKKFGNKDLRLFFENVVDFDKKDLKEVGQEYINKMKEISNSSDRTTDKLPINFLNIGFIKLILPNSKIVHCYRNPKDNCLSIYKNHFSSGKVHFAFNLGEIVGYYNLYNSLMKYWKHLLPNFIYDIKYENLISNTDVEIKNLLANCDLDWSDECLNFYKNKRPVKTASDVQVRNKIYSSSVNSWRNYQKYLEKEFENLKIN